MTYMQNNDFYSSLRMEDAKISSQRQATPMSEEELKDMASWLENILQDLVPMCENECCETSISRDFVPELAVKIVEIISNDYRRPLTDTEKVLQGHIKFLQETVDKLLAQLKKNESQWNPYNQKKYKEGVKEYYKAPEEVSPIKYSSSSWNSNGNEEK